MPSTRAAAHDRAQPAGDAGGTEAHQRNMSIDALRAVAALSVVGFHAGLIGYAFPYSGATQASFRLLDAGVELFFVISGYLIGGPFVVALVEGRGFGDMRSYALRRICRILPAYWVALAAAGVVLGGATLPQWIAYALLIQNPIPGYFFVLLPIAWTLEIEIVFYIAAPLVMRLARRAAGGGAVPVGRVATAIVAVWVASAGCAALAGTVGGRWAIPAQASVPATIGLFCPGMLVALARSQAGRSSGWARQLDGLARRAPLWLGLAAALLAIEVLLTLSSEPAVAELRRQPAALASMLVLAGVLAGGRRVAQLAALLAPVGVASYSIYLWHLIVRKELYNWDLMPGTGQGVLTWPLDFAGMAAVTIVVAAISYRLVERPAIQWSHRRASLWRARARHSHAVDVVASPDVVTSPAK